MKSIRMIAATMLLTLPLTGWSQPTEPVQPHEEYSRRVRAAEMVDPLSSELFGDQVSLYSGSTQFVVTDIEIPGTGPRVALGRVFNVENKRVDMGRLGGFGTWDIDVPHLRGTFDSHYPWLVGDRTSPSDQRCSMRAFPVFSGRVLDERMVFSGVTLHIPGGPTEEVLYLRTDDIQRPSPEYLLGTRSQIKLRCLSQLSQSGGSFGVVTGEGFEAIDTVGTRYKFDVAVAHNAATVDLPPQTPDGPVGTNRLGRVNVYLMASEVRDRFGNYVRYYYNNDGSLDRIRSSDGRLIKVTSRNSRGNIAGVTAGAGDIDVVSGARTWTYEYEQGAPQLPQTDSLKHVVLPDQSRWTYAQSGSLEPSPPVVGDGGICNPKPTHGSYAMTITHPAGAVGLFEFGYGRSERRVRIDFNNDCTAHEGRRYALFTEGYSLARKTIDNRTVQSAPDIWWYSSGLATDADAAGICPGCGPVRVIGVGQPDGSRREYVFGAEVGSNEGRLFLTRTLSADGEVLSAERTKYAYLLTAEHWDPPAPYKDRFGEFGTSDDSSTYYRNPVMGQVITRQGQDFVRANVAVDTYERPTSVQKFSAPSGQSTPPAGTQVVIEEITYQDYPTNWVMGQIKQVVSGGNLVTLEREFDPVSLQPKNLKQFGRLLQTYEYWPTGEVRQVKDPAEATVVLSDYKLGIPRNILLPLVAGQIAGQDNVINAEVDDWGRLTRVINQLGHPTRYEYDAAGRLSKVVQPLELEGAQWFERTINFSRLAADIFGLKSGLLMREVSEGSLRARTYYDGRMRPLLTHTYGVEGSSRVHERFMLRRFDADNRETFVSRPVEAVSGIANILPGSHTSFDALGRPRTISQDSELGEPVVTEMRYESPFRTVSKNARGYETTTYFQTFDQPSTDSPRLIEQPLGVTLTLQRDLFGKPLSITRSGAFNIAVQSLTRTFVYDNHQRLCKRVEPETGAALFDYDLAGNLYRTVEGQNLPNATCDRGAVAPAAWTLHHHDAQNRRTSTVYPDGVQNLQMTYTHDGLIASAAAGDIVTEFGYNARRLPIWESLSQGGQRHLTKYHYNSRGHVSGVTYPDGVRIDSNPNVHGEPTMAGSYATGAQYAADGFLSEFSYGNGVIFSAIANTRGLPEGWSYLRPGHSGVETLHGILAMYDQNANLMEQIDTVLPTSSVVGGFGMRSRSMLYDALDRLESAESPGLWGAESFVYDGLDNIHQHTTDLSTVSFNHNARNLLSSLTSGGVTLQSTTHDSRGFLQQRDGQPVVFSRDARLRQVGSAAGYLYDQRGYRVLAPAEAGFDRFVYAQGGKLLTEISEVKGQYTNYVYLGARLVAKDKKPLPALAAPSLSAPSTSTGSYTVQWGGVSNAQRYELQQRIGSAAWISLDVLTGVSRAFSAVPTGSYTYRVRACGSLTCSANSNEATVNVSAASLPAPTLELTAAAHNGRVSLRWNEIPGASRYELEEKFGSNPALVVYNGAVPSASLTKRDAGSYSYRVRACSSSTVCGAWSTALAVNMLDTPPQIAQLSGPASSSGSHTLAWLAAASASRYELEQRLGAGNWQQVYSGVDLSWTSAALPVGNYSYQVRACNAAGCSPYTGPHAVQVTGVIPVPALTVPGTNIGGSYEVSWSPVAAAVSYELQERFNGGAFATIQNTGVRTRSFSNKPAGSFGYQVRACLANGCGAYSPVATVEVQAIGTPALSGPGVVNVASFDLSWTPVTGAPHYRLESNAGGGDWVTEYEGVNRIASVSVDASGSHAYRARACVSANNCGPTSNVVTVQVNLSVPPPPVPTGLTVQQTHGGGSCRISWDESAGTHFYQLQIQAGEQIYSGGLNYFDLDTACGPGYRVRACNATACSDWAGGLITPLPPAAPTEAPVASVPATAPSGNYTVTWTLVANATFSRLQEREGQGSWTEVENLSSGSKLFTMRSPGTYSYRAYGCNSGGCGPASVEVSVTVARPPAPTITAPATSPGNYTVSWTPVSEADHYLLVETTALGIRTEFPATALLSRDFTNRPPDSYGYTLQACNAAGACSDFATATVLVPSTPATPPVPTGLTVTPSPGQCRVNWDIAEGASYYMLKTSDGQTFNSGSNEFLWDTDCAPDYAVSACANPVACSAWSAWVPRGFIPLSTPVQPETQP